MARLKTVIRALSLLLLLSPILVRADALDDILGRKTLRVGVADFVPWTMKSRSGELIGFEIDVARKIARDMGVEPAIKLYEFEKLIPALKAGEIDVIAGGMAITPQRALQVNFTTPLANSGISLATNTEKTKNVSELRHLNDERMVIAVVADTLAHSVAETFFPKADIRTFANSEQAEKEILENRAHVYVASVPEINFMALLHRNKVDVPLSEPIMASSEGLAVRKGEQQLLNFLNSWIVAREADKWLATTHNYWFETIEWAQVSSD